MADIRSFFGGGNGKPLKSKSSESKSKHVKKKEKKVDVESSEVSTKKSKNNDEVKKKKRIIIDSDSDEEPLPTKLRKKTISNGDDSGSEDPIPPTPKTKEREKPKVHKSLVKSDQLTKPPPKKDALVATTAVDFFGSAPVESSAVPVKRKKERNAENDEPPSKKEKSTENSEPVVKMKKKLENNESQKEKSTEYSELVVKMKKKLENNESQSEKKSSLASKLSSKVKESEGFMNTMKEKTKTTGESNIKVKDGTKVDKVKSTGPESKMKDSLKDYINQAKEKEKKVVTQKEKTETTPTKGEATISSKTPTAKTPTSKTPTSKTPTSKTPPVKEKDAASEETDTPVENKNKSYWAYKSREGPSAIGSKELPVIGESDLAGLTFVITGVLEAFDRDEFTDYIKRYGGKVTTAVSGKTSYLIVGREPGESKITKAEKCGTKKLDEDSFIELVKSKCPAAKKSSENVSVHVSPKKKKEISSKEKAEKSLQGKSTPPAKTPPAKTPPAKTPPAKTPPAKTPPAKTPPAKTPPAKTPSAKTPPVKEKDSISEESETPKAKKNNYWSFKARDGPSALGSKTLPEAGESCLAGLTFVITGVLEAFDREEFVDYIQRYGGKVTSAVSGKTSYLIVGREPGESKITKAEKCNTKKLDEDSFIEMVKSKSPAVQASPKTSKKDSPVKIKHEKIDKDTNKKSSIEDGKAIIDRLKGIKDSSPSKRSIKDSPSSLSGPNSRKSTPSSTPNTQSPSITKTKESGQSLLWVDKYKPKTLKQIVGQQGEKSNANKLKKWLSNWKMNNDPGAKKNFHAGKDDGSIFKAALLSGPPGVGKTTTATLVCQEMGFSYVEMNASDTRGKKALETEIKESLSNVTVNGMIQGKNNGGRNHVLIMDEVDGMAGNEDRGGMQELIALIKKSQIPIICMCNDRNHQKIRSLANYTFDLRCYKPRVEQIKGFALSIAAKEGLKIPPQAMEQIVLGTNQDIRQVLHNMQMWTSTEKSLSYDESKDHAKNANKNIKIGNFEIVRKLFSRSESAKMNINERIGLFFEDYSFVPLFMQENYIYVNPAQGSGNIRTTLETMSRAADSIADGNHVEKILRSKQAWSLLPLHGLYSTVIPSMTMSGYIGQKIEFPRWLGKNSSTGKHDRILQELKTHMALTANCMKSDVNLDYLPILKHRLTRPLLDTNLDASVAAKNVISFMDDYNLTREDWDSITDISKWGNEPDITSKIPSKVKSAFTRLYNKEGHKTPFAVHQAAKKSKGQGSVADNVLVGEGEEVDEQKDDDDEKEDITKDAMIKVKNESKAGSSSKSKATKSKSDTGKSKGSGSGKNKK